MRQTDASARNVFLQRERERERQGGSRDQTMLTSRDPASSSHSPAFHEILLSRDEILWKCSCRRPPSQSVGAALCGPRYLPSGLCRMSAVCSVCSTTADGWWPDSSTALFWRHPASNHLKAMWRSRDKNCSPVVHSLVLFGLPARFEINSPKEKYPEKKTTETILSDSFAGAFGLIHPSRYLNISLIKYFLRLQEKILFSSGDFQVVKCFGLALKPFNVFFPPMKTK